MAYDLIGFTVLAVWLYLIVVCGAFWLASARDDSSPSLREAWPSVVAIVPARDEADCIGESISSLLRQRYPGEFSIILVDDQSRDRTAEVASRAATELGAAHRLTVVPGRVLPAGWAGKPWALHQGVDLAEKRLQPASYYLLTDADIVYSPNALAWLVAQSHAGGFLLTSLMAKLRCESLAERALVPAFVFFFQMLYPFPRVNKWQRATAAAAGGCMLVRRDALRAVGGIAAIRGALIEDCALAKKLKAKGPIWLGLTEQVRSIRPYPRIDDIRQMVSRTAYAQLNYSPVLLGGAIAGLTLTYLAPVVLALLGSSLMQLFGLIAWVLMAIAFQPMLRFYHRSPLWGPILPAIAFAYMAFTLNSAYQHARGRGGLWKGRVQASASELR